MENHIIVIIHCVLLMRKKNESAYCYPFQGIATTTTTTTTICSRVASRQTDRETERQAIG
jgi:hypothetical protein